jgi:hypothetical protein
MRVELLAKRVLVYVRGALTALGIFVVFMILVRSCSFLYVDEISRQLLSPDGKLRAYQQVTRGGFGTAWTTRIFVEEVAAGKPAMIYSNKDSDFEPPYRWTANELLTVCVPSDRIDFMSNPADYSAGQSPIQRFRVRFSVSPCSTDSEPA